MHLNKKENWNRFNNCMNIKLTGFLDQTHWRFLSDEYFQNFSFVNKNQGYLVKIQYVFHQKKKMKTVYSFLSQE